MSEVNIQNQFEQFRSNHPEVEKKLVTYVRRLRRAGHTSSGIGMLWERLRYDYAIRKGAKEEFKLNNNFRSRYARFLMDTYPECKGFFDTRKLRAK